MSENQFQAQPRPQNAFDNKKLRISGKNEAGKMCFMAVSLINNNPRLSIYTNIDGDKDNGRIVGAFDTLGFGAFLELIKRAIESTTEVRWKIELMRLVDQHPAHRADGRLRCHQQSRRRTRCHDHPDCHGRHAVHRH